MSPPDDFEDAVGRRIADWAAQSLADELNAAVEEFVGPERKMSEDDIQLFATWFHNDRQLAAGGTPAEHYAALPGLPAAEREVAQRIAGAGVGLHRVCAVEPGRSLTLQDIIAGTRVRVASDSVSREAVRWDILLARVMDGEPPSLWGPVRVFEAHHETELRAELERLAGTDAVPREQISLTRSLHENALAMMRFTPPSQLVERSFFTLEGDPVAFCTATLSLGDAPAARKRLRAVAGLRPKDPAEIDITMSRDELVRQRGELPDGAIVLEASPIDNPDCIPVASIRIDGAMMRIEALSENRLDRALDIAFHDFGDLVHEIVSREVAAIEEQLTAHRPETSGLQRSSRLSSAEHRLASGAMTERMRRWLDEPHPALNGQTPRQAATGEQRADVVSLVRGLENGAERARRNREPFADLSWLRTELDVEDELAA